MRVVWEAGGARRDNNIGHTLSGSVGMHKTQQAHMHTISGKVHMLQVLYYDMPDFKHGQHATIQSIIGSTF